MSVSTETNKTRVFEDLAPASPTAKTARAVSNLRSVSCN